LRKFSSQAKKRKIAKVAVIGNNPKVNEYITKHSLNSFMTPTFFQKPEDMMAPANYDAALIVNSNPKQMEDFLKVQKSIKWVHSTMAGVDWIINDTLKNSDIVLTNAKSAFSYSLAEYILFGMLYFCKKTPYFNMTRKQHKWAPIDVEYGKRRTVGIIGYGNIGSATAKLLKQTFNSKIFACCNNMNELGSSQKKIVDVLVEAKDYDIILKTCDYVVGILPKTPMTVNYFDINKFKMMKKSAVFMNIGRGVTMVEKDLVQALKENIISGAVLDVLPQEPLPETSELYEMNNVLMTYHCADRIPDYWERTMRIFENELNSYVSGKPFKNVIAKEKGY